MKTLIRLTTEDTSDNLADLAKFIADNDSKLLARPHSTRSGAYLTEVIVALGSAGAFTALVEILKAYFAERSSRKLIITSERGSLTLDATGLENIETISKSAMERILPVDFPSRSEK